MLRFLFFFLLLYVLLRGWRRLRHFLFSSQDDAHAYQSPYARTPRHEDTKRRSKAPLKIVDEIRPCPHCATYNPTRLAFKKNDLYFCDRRCHEAHLQKEFEA